MQVAVNFQHLLPCVRNITLLPSLDVNCGFFHSETTKFTIFVLFDWMDKILFHDLMGCPERMFLYLTPSGIELHLHPSAFWIETSKYTSKTTSARLLGQLVTKSKILSASTANVAPAGG